jgi:homoserine dehydrogenase
MFVFGEKFETALLEAQKMGYAERNPDADVLGTDACRKISILTALATEKLYSPDLIHTEGITKIRAVDVKRAEASGATIKLVARCILEDGEKPQVVVAPFIVPGSEPLSSVSGVYNAIEIIAEPLGNVMFYGKGAGAGATASAVIGDLCQIMRSGNKTAHPVFAKSNELRPISEFSSEKYIAVAPEYAKAAKELFGNVRVLCEKDEFAFITEKQTEAKTEELLSRLGITPISLIRILG